jgi:hypothetical protein
MSEAFNEIATAVMRLQTAMRKHRIEPAVITLSSAEDGERFRHMAIRYMAVNGSVSLAVDEKGNPVMQTEVCGTIIRWPAQRYAMRSGGFEYR